MSDFDPQQFRDEITEDVHRRMHRHGYRFHHRRHSGPGGIIIGTTVVLLGVLFLLENFGIVHTTRVWQYWPVILIAWGIAGATSSRRGGGRLWGGVVVIAGVVLLLGNLHIISESVWRILWPVVLIALGLRMLLRAARRRRRIEPRFPDEPPPPGDDPGPGSGPAGSGTGPGPGHLEEWAVFGGSRRRVDSQDFKGGEVSAVFGGVELDLRPAVIIQDEVVIEADAVFGGVDIQVPENWNVIVEGHGIFGGYDDQTSHTMREDARPRVVVMGNAVFGGVVIKN
jgi:predicted membrane protein